MKSVVQYLQCVLKGLSLLSPASSKLWLLSILGYCVSETDSRMGQARVRRWPVGLLTVVGGFRQPHLRPPASACLREV